MVAQHIEDVDMEQLLNWLLECCLPPGKRQHSKDNSGNSRNDYTIPSGEHQIYELQSLLLRMLDAMLSLVRNG